MGTPFWDIEYVQENGTLAIRPSRHGRLKNLVKRTKGGDDRVWVFKTVREWIDDQGDDRIDHHTRGVICGSHDEGRVFLTLCRELGLSVTGGVTFYVPFSNSLGAYSKPPKGGQSAVDCNEKDLKLMRWDLPSRETLVALLPPVAPKPKKP